MENLDELTQTVALMGTDNTDEFFDMAQRNRKYSKVDPQKGPELIEKYVPLVFLAQGLHINSTLGSWKAQRLPRKARLNLVRLRGLVPSARGLALVGRFWHGSSSIS